MLRHLLLSTDPALYFDQPRHTAFHDLQRTARLPMAVRTLLGLGLKYCLLPRQSTSPNNIDLQRFKRDLYWKIIFAGGPTTAPPALYIPSNQQPDHLMIPPEIRARVSVHSSARHSFD